MNLTRRQIKTLYHQFGAIEATHPKVTVELEQAEPFGLVHASLHCSPGCHPSGYAGWQLDLYISPTGELRQ